MKHFYKHDGFDVDDEDSAAAAVAGVKGQPVDPKVTGGQQQPTEV